MKHKHADMIIAKAENMDLVVFLKFGDDWIATEPHASGRLAFDSRYDYFLCLPQHKEACVHWLNGGDVEIKIHDENRELRHYKGWDVNCCWMESNAIRIKPRKEKRWIGFHPQGKTTPLGKTEKFVSDIALHQLVDIVMPFCEWQFIEIEIEV